MEMEKRFHWKMGAFLDFTATSLTLLLGAAALWKQKKDEEELQMLQSWTEVHCTLQVQW